MGKEIERKFLLTAGSPIPIPAKYTKTKIKQGYISLTENIRVRLIKKKAILCVKFSNGIVRDEFEYEIPFKDGKEMFNLTTKKLEKKRLSFKRFKEHYDIDEYPNGLIVVEVEFKSIEHMEKWVKPSWIGEDITGKSEYSNLVLAEQNLKFND
jgi:CYTH domain-containing protein